MLKNRINVAFVTALAAIALSTTVLAQEQTPAGIKAPAGETAQPTGAATQGAAATAIADAAKANKYIFLFFYRTEDEPTLAARKTFDAVVEKFVDRATSTAVNVTDPLEQALVNKYQLNRTTMPLVLVMAPNGAVTRGFPGQITEAQLEMAFVSPGMQKVLKALQDRKMALLCVQNDATQHNAEAMQGVKDFVADALYAKTTEVITIDPTDAAEDSLLKQFNVDPKTEEAVTVFVAPPGKIVGTYKGETKKDVLVAAAKTAAKACTPGGSCCPAPKKPATPPAQPPPQQPGSTEKKP